MMRSRVIHWITIITDLLLINVAFWMAYVARYDSSRSAN